MASQDMLGTLRSAVTIFSGRDWGSPEKNNAAVDLSRRVQNAITMHDVVEMTELVKEAQFFMSESFLLFKRIESLVRRHRQKTWRTVQDNIMWSMMMDRAVIIIRQRDRTELGDLAPRIIRFLRQRNEHVLAQGLEDAQKTK